MLKFFGIFLVIWIAWYLTGGPQRAANLKPFVKYDEQSNVVNIGE